MWNPFKKKNKSKQLKLETIIDSLIDDHIKSMLEACYEYSNWNDDEIDDIYIFCSTEEGLFPTWFYRIDSKIVKAHELNNYVKLKCDTSHQGQRKVLTILADHLFDIDNEYEAQQREMPTRIKISYNLKNNKFNVDLDYKKELIGTELTDHDLLEKWMDELK